MAAFVEVGSNGGLQPLRMTAKQLAFHHQDVRTPPAMASDSLAQGASLDHLLAHLESSKQALEHQVQQLLQENRLSKSAKKEQQWHMEGERLYSKLDNLNAVLVEKEDRIKQLEKELRDARGTVQNVQSRCREAEKEKEREALARASMQADLEDAQANFENLEREYKLKHDVAEKQRRALESLSDKVEKQRLSFQNQLEDFRKKLIESEESEQKHELAAQLASQHLAEKERQLKSLRDAHEKLIAVQKGKHAEERHEVKEVLLALESSHAKCEEKIALIKDLEQELGRIRKEAHHLDTRAAAAEADATSKASMLEKAQMELKNIASHGVHLAKAKSQTEDLKAQVEALKRTLQEVEDTLSEESALRFKAECALNECKVREKSFLKLEQDGKVLQEEVKWRNEQFEALEAAHDKMRDQFHEGLSMWAAEKAAIVKDIEVLTENVQSRDIVIHDLRSQVKLREQSLAHEENCRKLLEFQLADAKAGYENVTAEYLAAQSILENLRENSKNELAFLKNTLEVRDGQLKELHVKQTQIDQDQKKLMQMEAELNNYRSICEDLQEALEKGSTEADFTRVLGSEGIERLMGRLTDAEASIAKKEVEMKELEMELDRTRTLSELLRTSLSEAEGKRLEGSSDAIRTLEKLSESLSEKELHAMKLEAELERIHADAERRIEALEDKLRNAHRELQSIRPLNVQEHEEVVLTLRSECEALQNNFALERLELVNHRDQVVADQKHRYQREKKELLTKLENLGKQCTLKDTQLNDLLDQIEREKNVISTLEARCASSEQELLQIREELVAEKLNARVHQERALFLDAALSADAAAKDASLQEIKDALRELKVLCKGGEDLRISSIEEKLAKHDSMEGRLVSLLGELNAVVFEVERVAQGAAFLNIELNSLKDDSKLTKTEFQTRLRAVEGLFSSSFAELQEISEQVGKMTAERISLVEVLSKKEGDLELLSKENSSLSIEKTRLEANADILEEKLLKLVKEAESNKAIIDTLNVNMKEGVATELHEIQAKLEESENKNLQLVSVADQARGLERQLRATEAIVHDKEQRLAASEWAVQQLAGEIAKSKSFLAQKERDEAASRDRLEHSEAELKVKQTELTELQCDLENAVKANNEKHILVQQLTLSKEETVHVLELTKRALDEKTAALATSEAELKKLLKIQRLTEEALNNSKERLSKEQKTNLALEMDMKRLCEDLERANQEASLAETNVKNLQETLKCLESTTEARLQSCERKMEQGVADLVHYQENCAGLLALVEKKDARMQQLEVEVSHALKELEKERMCTEQSTQELHFVSEQLESKTKMLTGLKVELATVDGLVKELQTQKRELEHEVRGLKSSLSVATRKGLEMEEERKNVEQILSQQGDAHSEELQMITSKLTQLQIALNGAQGEVQKAQEVVSMKEEEKRVLSLRLSELESLVETGQSQISQLQADLQVARVNLEAETERVWHQVASRNEIETELDAWKARAADFESEICRLQAELKDRKEVAEQTDAWEMRVASMQSQFESSMKKSQEWKEVAERTELLNAELEKSMQAVRESVEGWENIITSLADEGDVAKLHLEFVLKQVHDEFRTLHADLAITKDVITTTRHEGHTLKTELLEDSQALTTGHHLEGVVSELEQELSVWKSKALNSQSQLQQWRQRAEEWESFNKVLEQALVDFEHALLECKSDAGSSDLKLDIQVSFGNLRKEVEEVKCELLELKNVAAKESNCVSSLQAEVEACNEKAAVATKESSQMKHQFEELLKNLQSELKNWKQFEALALGENPSAQTVVKDSRVIEESSVVTPNSINPFHQEDEGCSSSQDSDDTAAAQLDGWNTKSSISKEGRKLTRQFRASFKHLQFELESRKQAAEPKMVKHSSFVHRHDDTGLESLVKALQEEAFEIKAELADWKNKAIETGTLKEDLERTINKLEAEVEGWKDRFAMAAGQRIVARRQLDDFAKQVMSLNGELQKWKDVATESNEGATKLQSELEQVQNEKEEVRAELQEWMQRVLELNCVIKDGESRIRELELEVERSNALVAKAEEEGKVAKMELLNTLGKFEDELEVMSSNSISTAEGRSFKEEDSDYSWQTSGRVEWRNELEVSLQAEIEDWKKKVAEQEALREAYETTVKELRMEVESLKCIEMENKVKVETSSLELAELELWKKRATDAAEECTSLRDAYENVIKELTQWKAKSEAATEECQSVRVDLENVVQDLQHQVNLWKEKAEKALENVVKSQEYEDLIKALEEELCLWAQRTQDSKLLQDQLEHEQVLLTESLTATQNELQKWKDQAVSAVTSIRSLQDSPTRLTTILEDDEDEVNIDPLSDEDEEDDHVELQQWKSRAEHAELLQMQLEDVLAETQTELNEWKQKAADFGLAAEFLKEELECLIEEGRLEKEELLRSNQELETQLESSKLALQKWDEKAAAITQSTRSLMQEFDLTIEEGQLEKQEFHASINVLKSSVLVLKSELVEGESMQSELKATLLQTQTELDKATVAIATKSDDNEKLCNTIRELEDELCEWKSRAQEGVSVQLHLERALSEMEEKAAAVATNTQALKEELDKTIAESSGEIQELCNAITGLETELSEVKEAENRRFPQLQQQLAETESLLQEWQDKATVASHAEEELRQAVEEIKAETAKLDNFIRALKEELHEWKEKAEHLATLQVQLTSSLASSEQELQRWKQKATEMEQEGEFLHQQTRKSQELKEQISALTSFTDSLKEELNSATELASHLTTQLNTQKQNEESLQKLNRQLEADLVLAREEAFARKQKMTEIFTQLERSTDSQKELQRKLHLAQHRLLASQAESMNLATRETAAAKANFTRSDDVNDVASCNSSPETEFSLELLRTSSSDIFRTVSVKNPAADKMRQELVSLKSLVSKLEHVRAIDDDVTEEINVLGRAGDDEELLMEDNAVQRPEALLQKQVESSRMIQEGVHSQMIRKDRSRSQRLKVLADVNGNSPRAATANLHDMKLHREK